MAWNMRVREETTAAVSRRDLLRQGVTAGAGLVAGGMLLGGARPAWAQSEGDKGILTAALIAEGLATTLYTQVLSAPFFNERVPGIQRPYFTAAREQEMAHVNILQQVLGLTAPPVTEFYYPKEMFKNEAVFIPTLLALEEAFIAAYTVGATQFENPAYRTAAARILGVECEHRALARIVGRDLGLEPPPGKSYQPPNNLCFQKTLKFTGIGDAVKALTPFIDKSAAQAAGFDTASFKFAAFTPSCPDDEA